MTTRSALRDSARPSTRDAEKRSTQRRDYLNDYAGLRGGTPLASTFFATRERRQTRSLLDITRPTRRDAIARPRPLGQRLHCRTIERAAERENRLALIPGLARVVELTNLETRGSEQ